MQEKSGEWRRDGEAESRKDKIVRERGEGETKMSRKMRS